ncbi:uncharacterized protein LOC103698647 isoform X2 [Phoenix dactylifera]|uniref:Uncharacterized protein LOC103698647 isoform X2 n=1 Tax=Phoenix dactylifera TaxID=42345 RepID=A0A8B8ZLL8_PHODC|nr:uncharacterized protein LOC103700338 isoform X2 [Phoenix dactylifera]XP_038981540.1 uncharacterized protein LOC103698647 isoform X2 [Phoenix dactylifera]
MRRGLLLSALAPLARAPTGLLRTARWRWRTELLRCRSRLLLLPPPSIFSRCVIASRNGSLEGYGSLRLQFANDCLKGISIWTMIQVDIGNMLFHSGLIVALWKAAWSQRCWRPYVE